MFRSKVGDEKKAKERAEEVPKCDFGRPSPVLCGCWRYFGCIPSTLVEVGDRGGRCRGGGAKAPELCKELCLEFCIFLCAIVRYTIPQIIQRDAVHIMACEFLNRAEIQKCLSLPQFCFSIMFF